MSNEEIINSIINSFHENNNSHAFLVDTNNLDLCYQDIIKIVKTVNCKNGTIDDCNVCHTIDVGTNPDIITVKPEKKEIGVEPIDNIIKAFSTQPLISKYSMYIIFNADLMSVQAANTILKFLEEPEENVVGFFITDRINSILPTISSRCELINIRYGSKTALDLLNITGEEFDNLFDKVKNIINILSYETKYQMMSKSDEISKLEREDILKIFKIIYRIYVIKFENIVNNEYNNVEYAQEILSMINEEDVTVIVKRIKLLEEFINDFKYNVNKDLFINKLFITWE